jgi:hypothetical protein
MATTIDDLTYELRFAASGYASEAAKSNQVRPALRHLGRAMHRLAQIGLSDDGRIYQRDSATRELATACLGLPDTRLDDAEPAYRDRLTEVAGALADASIVRGIRGSYDERWAIAAHLASTCHALTSFAPQTALPTDLRWIRHIARAVNLWELRDPAPLGSTAVLDAPSPTLAGSRPAPIHVAADAAAALAYRLENHRAKRFDAISAWEVLTVTKSAASVSRYAAVITSAIDGGVAPTSTANAWHATEGQLYPFLVGRTPMRLESDVSEMALAMHRGMRDTFGPIDTINADRLPRLDDIRALQRTVNQLAPIADSLEDVMVRAAVRGDLHAKAHHLPQRDNRAVYFLDKRPIVADEVDVVPTKLALLLASGLSAHLAVTLADSAGGTTQPALTAALRNRIAASPPVAQMADEARWHAIALTVDHRLTVDPDWPQLASTMQVIRDRGLDVTVEVRKAMERGGLPREHPARALDYRLHKEVRGLPPLRPIGEDVLPLPTPGPTLAGAARAPRPVPRIAR